MIINGKQSNETAGTLGVAVFSDSFGEEAEKIKATLKPGNGYGVNSDSNNLERDLIIGDASPRLSITEVEDAIEGDWGWFVVDWWSINSRGRYVCLLFD